MEIYKGTISDAESYKPLFSDGKWRVLVSTKDDKKFLEKGFYNSTEPYELPDEVTATEYCELMMEAVSAFNEGLKKKGLIRNKVYTGRAV